MNFADSKKAQGAVMRAVGNHLCSMRPSCPALSLKDGFKVFLACPVRVWRAACGNDLRTYILDGGIAARGQRRCTARIAAKPPP